MANIFERVMCVLEKLDHSIRLCKKLEPFHWPISDEEHVCCSQAVQEAKEAKHLRVFFWNMILRRKCTYIFFAWVGWRLLSFNFSCALEPSGQFGLSFLKQVMGQPRTPLGLCKLKWHVQIWPRDNPFLNEDVWGTSRESALSFRNFWEISDATSLPNSPIIVGTHIFFTSNMDELGVGVGGFCFAL